MSVAPQVVHICDHLIVRDETEIIASEHEKSSTDIDVIIQDGDISEFHSLYETLEDETFAYYYEGIDFNPEGTKSIKWISANRPSSTFIAEYTRSKFSYNQYTLDDCPRCAMSGWFVSIFNSKNTKVRKVKEYNKLVQDFIKILLTYKTGSYGTVLKDIQGQDISDEVNLTSEIINIVFDAESQYKRIQSEESENRTPPLDSERLRSATVSETEYDRENGGIFVSIILTSESDETSQLNLLV